MKKICIITPEGYPVPATKGGAVETLVELLLKQNEINKKLDIVCISRYEKNAFKKSKEFRNTRFEYLRMPSTNKYIQFFLNLFFRGIKKIFKVDLKSKIHCYRLYNKMKKYKFDLIIVEGGDPLVYKQLLSRYNKKECVLHLHGGSIVGNKQWNEIYGKYIALNNFLKKRFISNNIVLENQVEVVHNGIEIDKFQKKLTKEEVEQLKKQLNINKNNKIILFCGRIIKEKGILELIKSFKKLDRKDITLLVIGSAEFGNKTKTNYEKLVEKEISTIKDSVIFTGFVHNSELYKYYNLADIGVIPSIWEEASPLVAAEMMTSGLPLICTDSGGLPEIVTDEGAYIIKRDEHLIDNIAEKIDLLLKNEDLRKERKNNSINIGKKYSTENFYNEFVIAVEKFIKEK